MGDHASLVHGVAEATGGDDDDDDDDDDAPPHLVDDGDGDLAVDGVGVD